MRIGIFSESYIPVPNGVSISIVTLKEELRKIGHEVHIFAPSYPGYADTDSQYVTRFPSIRTRSARDYPLAIPYMSGFTDKVRRMNLDIIHTHTPFMLGMLGLRAAKRLDIPLISTNHTQYAEYVHYFPLVPVTATKKLMVQHMRSYYNRCDGIVVPSSPVENMLRDYGITRPAYVIPTGNSLCIGRDLDMRANLRRKYGIPDDATVLVYVGRLAREKNVGMLLDAYENLANRHENAYLMLIGTGPCEDEYKATCTKMACADRIIFTGAMPRERVGEHYSAGDLFAFPSTTETQGLVICEALSAGLPAVVVRAGGCPEMVAEGEDSLIAENDVADFAEKIARFLSDNELLRTFSENALRIACRFSPNQMALNMLQAYEAVICSHNNGRGKGL